MNQEIENVFQRLNNGGNLKSMNGDGNCGYHALGIILSLENKKELNVTQLRKSLYDHPMDNKDKFVGKKNDGKIIFNYNKFFLFIIK